MNMTVKIFYFFFISFVVFNLLELFNFSTGKQDATKNLEETEKLNSVTEKKLSDHYKIFAIPINEPLNFAGEEVPLENFDVRESFDRELLINVYWQSQTLLFFKRANRHFPEIERILKKNEVPSDFKYLILVESGITNVVSPAGAAGYWQFLKESGKEYGLEINEEVDERYNLEKSTEAACKYFKEAYKKFGNWTMAAASYNVGKRGIEKQIERQKMDSFYDVLLNEETTRYIYKTIAVKYIIENPQKYGFFVEKEDLYPEIPTYKITIDSAVTHWADFASKFNTNYKILKHLNPWLRQVYLRNTARKTYTITLLQEGARAAYKDLNSINVISPNDSAIEIKEPSDENDFENTDGNKNKTENEN